MKERKDPQRGGRMATPFSIQWKDWRTMGCVREKHPLKCDWGENVSGGSGKRIQKAWGILHFKPSSLSFVL